MVYKSIFFHSQYAVYWRERITIRKTFSQYFICHYFWDYKIIIVHSRCHRIDSPSLCKYNMRLQKAINGYLRFILSQQNRIILVATTTLNPYPIVIMEGGGWSFKLNSERPWYINDDRQMQMRCVNFMINAGHCSRRLSRRCWCGYLGDATAGSAAGDARQRSNSEG